MGAAELSKYFRLNQEIVRLLNTTEAREQLANIGVEALGTSPEQFAAKTRSQMSLLRKMIKDTGIRAG